MAEPTSLINHDNPALSGATAQTGGFAQAATDLDDNAPPAAFASSGFAGGGLGSSPNVPQPGHSIDPASGKPYAAGLTRAELLAKRETGEHAPLADLSGREQAARQLVGTVEVNPLAAAQTPGLITPGQELPGAWGPVEPVPPPGTAADAPSTIYEDVASALNKVGETAYKIIPGQVKDVLSSHPTDGAGQAVPPATTGTARSVDAAPASPSISDPVKALADDPTVAVATPRLNIQSNIQSIVNTIKETGKEIAHEIQDTYEHSPLGVAAKERDAQRRSQGTSAENSVIDQVKGFVGNLIGVADQVTAVDSRTGLATMRTSLPSDEVAGALSGEHSSGVGALPGTSRETGVAVLPDEKRPKNTLPSQENQGFLPGETSGGVGALPGTISETGVAVLPDERAAGSSTIDESDAGATAVVPKNVSTETAVVAKEPAPAKLISELPDTSSPTPAGTSHTANPHTAVAAKEPAPALLVSRQPTATLTSSTAGLAPPLPATFLGQGAAHGATDLHTESSAAAPHPITREPSAQLLNESTAAALAIATGTGLEAAPTMHAADRTTSTASVTAIRGGHEGDLGTKPSSLAASTVPEETISSPADITPGDATNAIGHPSTRGPETSRQVGAYPAPQHDGPAEDALVKANSERVGAEPNVLATDVAAPEERAHPSGAATAVAQDAKANEDHPNGWQAYKVSSPTSTSSANDASSHNRTSSTDSGGKKKVGFMSKLKGEIKVISGKIGHDDAKVAAGEKLKHGE
ncbi:hypothetical protein Q5752_006739 [Cryptotrichosporon argae]